MLVSLRVKIFCVSIADRVLDLRCEEGQGGEWEDCAFFLQYDLRFGVGESK